MSHTRFDNTTTFVCQVLIRCFILQELIKLNLFFNKYCKVIYFHSHEISWFGRKAISSKRELLIYFCLHVHNIFNELRLSNCEESD